MRLALSLIFVLIASAANAAGITIGASALGADPTGQVDAYPILQAALNAHSGGPTDGITITFGPGEVYKVCTPLKLSSSNVSLQGTNTKYGATLKGCSTSQAAIIDMEAPYVSVAHLHLAGPGGAIGGWGIESNGAHGCDLEDLLVTDLFNGISLYNSTNCRVVGNKMYNMTGQGMLVIWGTGGGSSGGDYVAFNQFDPVAPSGNQAGIYISGADQIYAAFNDITGNWSHAIFIENSFGDIIIGNSPSTSGQGAAVDLGVNTSGLVVTGNFIAVNQTAINNPNGSPGSILAPNIVQ